MKQIPYVLTDEWPDATSSVRGYGPHTPIPARIRWSAAVSRYFAWAMNDASKLTLPLRETVLVAVAAVTVAGAVWTAETGLRSSIQAVSDKIEADQKLQEERLSYMRDTITDLKKRQELTEIELRDLKDVVVRIEANGNAKR